MKIAVPMESLEPTALMASVFGRAPAFLVQDRASGNVTVLENPGTRASGGAGVEAAQAVVDAGATVVIAPKVGPKAQAVLEGAGVEVHVHASGGRVREIVDAYLAQVGD